MRRGDRFWRPRRGPLHRDARCGCTQQVRFGTGPIAGSDRTARKAAHGCVAAPIQQAATRHASLLDRQRDRTTRRRMSRPTNLIGVAGTGSIARSDRTARKAAHGCVAAPIQQAATRHAPLLDRQRDRTARRRMPRPTSLIGVAGTGPIARSDRTARKAAHGCVAALIQGAVARGAPPLRQLVRAGARNHRWRRSSGSA
jgi:hypothetical protein